MYDQSFIGFFYIYIKFSTTFSFRCLRFIGLGLRQISTKSKEILSTLKVQYRVRKTPQTAPIVHHTISVPPPPQSYLLKINIHIIFLRLGSFIRIFQQKFCVHLTYPSRL